MLNIFNVKNVTVTEILKGKGDTAVNGSIVTINYVGRS